MPVVNPLARELVFKVVYYGPGLGGKTTSLQHIHGATRAEHRGKLVSLATPVDRTLYFDFLPVRVPSVRGMGVRLQLFTVPGQVYYNATRKLVLTGADGVVLVVDSQAARRDANLESLLNLEQNLQEHGRLLSELPFVIQYNKRDLPDVLGLDELQAELNPRGVPSFPTVATRGEGIFEALERIAELVLLDFQRRMPEPSEPGAGLSLPEGGLLDALRRAEQQPPSARVPELPGSLGGAAVSSGAPEGSLGGLGDVLSRSVEGAALLGAAGSLGAAGGSSREPDEDLLELPASEPPSSAAWGEAAARQVMEPGAPASGAGFSFAALFSGAQRQVAEELEAALGGGDTQLAVERADLLVTRTFAAAGHLLSQRDAPKDPSLVALMLGLPGARYLEFRAIARAARGGAPPLHEDALRAYVFALEARLAWLRVGQG
ncbi:MAG: GTPase domain-containing protein [Polyangiaceae bacterium]|nr:GTPase domain-containing protein [Polyangiaceae bacterium]MCW5791511.1 GTPase domain-containing protein [Polyangiaceae bacterium]